ncbi:MAG: SDR family NAD(P)-dependent oxidoreductase [Halioglobus sp.]|nr:SDR family NAD(P)-dependent oxidoreductase [Halioglobus sp.]
MKVFVTGGTGFIGTHTCRALLDAGHTVKLFVRNREKAKKLFGNTIRSIAVGDIASASDVKKAMKGCDATIHMAAMVSTSKDDAKKVYQTNLAAAENVLGQAVDAGCRKIIHVSSVTAIYNPKAKTLNHDSPPGVAKNAYGRSKVECEKYARSLQEQGAPLHITYPASVIGPDDPGLTEPHEGLIANLYGLGLDMPSGNQYVDVRDVAAAHVALLGKRLAPGRYPLGGHYVSWKDLYATLERLTGRSLVMLPVTGLSMRLLGRTLDALKPFMDSHTPISHEAMVYATNWVKLDNAKTQKDLGISFRPVEQSLVEAIRWLERENHITRVQAGLLSRHTMGV